MCIKYCKYKSFNLPWERKEQRKVESMVPDDALKVD